MKTIICTTGTSIAGRNLSWTAETTAEGFRRDIRERVESKRQNSGKDPFLDVISAEIKSLRAIGAEPGDDVFLLHTPTQDGEICADIIAELLLSEMDIKARLRRIEKLQVADAVAFRREGVDNLFSVLKELTAGHDYDDQKSVFLNVTAGYKAIVPYVTLFGLLRRFDVVYIFERSDALIRLPPLPVQYDFEHLERASEAIRLLREAGVMPAEDFFRAIPDLEHADRRWYECLLESDNGSVTLSAIAEHLLEVHDLERLNVHVHPNVSKFLERMKGSVVGEHLCAMLDKVAEPGWRAMARHAFNGTDLECYKSPHSARRLAGYTEGRNFYACVIYSDHDEYMRDLVKQRRNDYRNADFVRWINPVQTDLKIESETQRMDVLMDRLEKEISAREQAEAQWQEAETQADQLKSRVKTAEAESARLKASLDDARQPWWRRLFRKTKGSKNA